ncbi:hypothetical protein F6476_12325 [Pseudomonas umsongensis]|uniref:Uncharacterized protein n=1 Tax=Pseudomonas umsongensis TaxID=198618 RepID=A0ABX4E117_9PSED|nr:hypothetical protein PSUM_05350 [Pseudomonas umsongensis]QFG29924.1 hypothetical protein F6476_12325 [Pseudomonas umsongensis]SDT29746.1 hypothetical protein SAMN04490206_2621 [Pseudomonas umsongensis]
MSNRRTVAMVVNDDAGHLTPLGALKFIACMLAPTGFSLAVVIVHLDLRPPYARRRVPFSGGP